MDTMTRQQLIDWLTNNDVNGCYSDEDMVTEGMRPLTDAELLKLYLTQKVY